MIQVGNSLDLFDMIPAPVARLSNVVLVRHGWSNTDAWIDWLNKATQWSSSPRQRDGSWCGGSWDQAVRFSREGWPEGAERVARVRDKIVARHPTRREPPKWSVCGATPDVPRCLAGNPMHMKAVDPRHTRRRPVVTFVSQYNAMADISADQLVRRAGITAALVDTIEAVGYSCHVISMGCSFDRNGKFLQVAVTLKEPQDALDIGRVSFGMGHPGVLRRFDFATVAAHNELRSWGEGMGSVYSMPHDPEIKDTYVLPTIDSMSNLFSSEEAAVERGLPHLIECLQKQGCPAFQGDDQ